MSEGHVDGDSDDHDDLARAEQIIERERKEIERLKDELRARRCRMEVGFQPVWNLLYRLMAGQVRLDADGQQQLANVLLEAGRIAKVEGCESIVAKLSGGSLMRRNAIRLLQRAVTQDSEAIKKALSGLAKASEPRQKEVWSELRSLIHDLTTDGLLTDQMVQAKLIEAAIAPAEKAARHQGGTGQGGKARPRGRRGRKLGSDPTADKRLCADWQAAKRQGMCRDAFARERGITVQALIDAQHREKYRRRRDAE